MSYFCLVGCANLQRLVETYTRIPDIYLLSGDITTHKAWLPAVASLCTDRLHVATVDKDA